ncbi:hypothetical protein KIPB_015244 [Kipferlia bialata]|uniref:Uncharacterized protein n=1 Tax=Kipferlia bialata TaxID=797122 RepID=A0A391P0U3_9EUKA|nr:hypothetical protein KIPB_015244 [Kipferlia bialata]|eukprot:g15244.t1
MVTSDTDPRAEGHVSVYGICHMAMGDREGVGADIMTQALREREDMHRALCAMETPASSVSPLVPHHLGRPLDTVVAQGVWTLTHIHGDGRREYARRE